MSDEETKKPLPPVTNYKNPSVKMPRGPNGCFLPNPNRKNPKRGLPGPLATKEISLEFVNRQLLNVLARETRHLLGISHAGKLKKDDAAALASYLKLTKDLLKVEEEQLESLSDEQLAKIAKK